MSPWFSYFLPMTVKNLSVVLSFNARKAIPHNTGLINSVATAAQQFVYVIKKDYMLSNL